MQIAVKELVDAELKKLGFTRKHDAWYRDLGEVLHLVGLQKSQWGSGYYVNLAVSIKSLSPNGTRGTSDCPLQCRIDALPDTPKELQDALSEEDYWRMDAAQRSEIINLALCNAEFLFFSELRTLPAVIHFVKMPPWPQLAVRRDLAAMVA